MNYQVALDTREAVLYLDQIIALVQCGVLSSEAINDNLDAMLSTIAKLVRVVQL